VKYDPNISRLLILYKEHKDEALAPIFLSPFSKKINKEYKTYVAVPLPSSKEKVEQRGFHHLHRMIESLDLDVKDVLEKRMDIKQAKMSRQQRESIDQIFDIRMDDNTFWENVVLIDDVCTTGASLQAAIRLMRPYCKNLRAITFAYHPLWISDG
jgi:competence protein ComFC